ncbi:MAG: DUF3267 domain-containing protein [Anaerolineales bacterium]|nr:DUF3267 domain-containing protein [Anaerolineales bacterium]
MKAITVVPSNYSQQAVLNPSKSLRFIVSAILVGTVLLIAFGWLFLQFIDTFRPMELDGMRIGDILPPTPSGVVIQIPPLFIRNVVIALVLVLILHELVHGLFYWWFSGKSPKFGFQGIFPYAAAPKGVYFFRNHFIIVGIAPLIFLTLIGLPLVLTVPAHLVPILVFFITLNASGSAGDALMVMLFLSYSADTVMEDKDSTVIIYGPGKELTDD